MGSGGGRAGPGRKGRSGQGKGKKEWTSWEGIVRAGKEIGGEDAAKVGNRRWRTDVRLKGRKEGLDSKGKVREQGKKRRTNTGGEN